jgi:hypothetical protein
LFNQVLAGIGIGGNGRKRLIDFVRNACGQFPQREQAIGMQQLLLQGPELLFGSLLLAQVMNDADEMDFTIEP